jgi:hypothetical protein
MIEVVIRKSSGTTATYFIYEDSDPSGVKKLKESLKDTPHKIHQYTNVRNAMRGDWVKDINGRYVPVLRVVTFKRHRDDTADKYEKLIIFPGHAYPTTNNKPFSYPIKKENLPKNLSVQEVLFGKQLAEGIDAWVAAQRSFRNIAHSPKKLRQRILRTFQKDSFIFFYLKHHSTMDKLKEALMERGITQDVIADHLERIIVSAVDPVTGAPIKAGNALRTWAYSTAMSILEKEEKKRPTHGILQGAVEDLAKRITAAPDSGGTNAMLVSGETDDGTYVLAALRENRIIESDSNPGIAGELPPVSI